MPAYLATATLTHKSGIARRDVQTSIVVSSTDPITPATVGEITIPLAQFFTQVQASGDSVGEYIADSISRVAGACRMRVYDITGKLGGAPHGSPVAEDVFQMPAAGTANALPEEVAVVLTTRALANDGQLHPVEAPDGADPGAEIDRPRARHAGRMFIGPLTNLTIDHDASGSPRPHATFLTTLRQSANSMRDLLAIDNHIWCVWSRRDAALYEIDRVETDDAFDTQRRRGAPAAVRTILTVN